ncbi:VPS10 domain-containing protein [Neolewinella litorea]|uniref:Glycosyl hydrolase n=1 Tax=Neolewinella litorea TaxID=2562452 RepID=A0A4S4NNK2_9BACT|nr:glycosyl hydrolase [Neolewinella litorea]THH39948.1 glycosyl hydrolase [Neolewinella litorea]
MNKLVSLITCLILPLFTSQLASQGAADTTRSDRYESLTFRNIGPFRGGRSNAVTGVPGHPLRYYFGGVGGGIYRTDDGGMSWRNISDGQLNTGSIGALTVAPNDPNVIYAGTGEHAVRGVMTSAGDGVYRSTDAGATWQHIGLENSRHISEILVHPRNPDHVYVAVQGAVHGDSEDRGIYRSTDGGQRWERVFYVDATTGAADLSMDPSNPRILYAGMWDHRRYPWTVRSGGPGSGLFKSTDGGTTWQRLTEGLPDTLGKVAVSVSPANPDRVYANLEAEGDKGGVYRSDDGGKNWKQTSSDRVTVARAWYYIEIFAAPADANEVYVLNAPVLRSIDGGASFSTIPVGHGDQHDLWINPENPDNMILGNDGGATVTFNGGKSWSTQNNQATAQFYRVITDRQVPYRIYGGQQDNSAVDIASRSRGGSIDEADWHPTAGGESAFLAFDPENPRYVMGGSYQGNISVYDNKTGTEVDVMAYPVAGLATPPGEMQYRFNWNAPIVAQPQDPSVFYHAGNHVLKSTDLGRSWTEISPDLTRNDTSKLVDGGGPFTNEGAGGEIYGTISYLVASPHRAGELWVGTDDGRVWLTRNEGANWQEITPPNLGEKLVNAIEVSPHDPATAYLAVTNYKFDDFTPEAYKTTDYGANWRRIDRGFGAEEFVRVIREDPKRPNLLYAGTERGLYLSFDGGASWEKPRFNLPDAPILDLTTQDNDLIVATSGRAFWILDDLSALQETSGTLPADLAIVQPKPTYRYNFSTPSEAPDDAGQNPANGIIFDYYLPEVTDSTRLTLDVLNDAGEVIRSYGNQPEKAKNWPGGPPPATALPAKAGLNRFNWDLRRATLPAVDGIFVLGDYRGSLAGPGTYTLRLASGSDTVSTTAQLLPDPNIEATPAQYAAQQKLLTATEDAVRDIHRSVNRMRRVREQVKGLNERLREVSGAEDLVTKGEDIVRRITDWENNLIQPDQKTFQDVINFPNRLNAELMNLKSRVDGAVPIVTEGAERRLEQLTADWQRYRQVLDRIIAEDVADFNATYRELNLPALIVPDAGETTKR